MFIIKSRVLIKIVAFVLAMLLLFPNLLLTISFATDIVKEIEENKNEIISEEKQPEETTLSEEVENVEEEKLQEKTTIELDKKNISTVQKNDVIFTINLDNQREYVSPIFRLELPENFEEIMIGEVSILNGETLKFVNSEFENKNIILQFEGSKQVASEKAQITIKAQIKTNKAMATKTEEIKLIYLGEEYKTEVNLIAPEEIILSNEIKFGEQEIKASYYDTVETSYKPNELNEAVQIQAKAINNTAEDIQNIIIVGKIGFNQYVITEANEFVIPDNATIKFSENQEGPWKEVIQPEDRFFKIEVEELKKQEEISFKYNVIVNKEEVKDKELKNSYNLYYNNYFVISPAIILKPEESSNQDTEIKGNDFDVEYKTQVYHNNDRTELAKIGSKIEYFVTIKNIKKDLEDILIKIDIPQGTKLIKTYLYKKNINTMQYEPYLNAEIKIEENVKVKTNLTKDEEYIFLLEVQVTELAEDKIENDVEIDKTVKNENYNPDNPEDEEYIKETISKNTFENEVLNVNAVEVQVKSNKENATLNGNDEIEYVVKISNKSQKQTAVMYEIDIPEEILITKIIVKQNGETESILEEANYVLDNDRKIEEETVLEIVLKGKVKNIEEAKTVEAKFKVESNSYTLTNYINASTNEETGNNEEDNNNENNEGDNEDNEDNQQENEEQTFSISGLVWLDKNKDGKIDEHEPRIKGVVVKLWDNNAKKYVTDSNNNDVQQISDDNGGYIFKKLVNGNYTVVFEYNKNTYSTTTYTTIDQDQTDSSAITVTENSKNITKTDTITVASKNVQNINLGLVFNKIFDLELTKKVTKITVETIKGTQTYEYEKGSTLSKVEIYAKQVEGAKVIVEYDITVKNAGAIPGYAKTIVDNIPEGFEFNSELNPNWYKGEDGKLYSKALAETVINSDEEKTIKLVLITTLTNEKLGTVTNTAEIFETFNEYALLDKDSTENNHMDDEDDYGKADLIITIKTGSPKMYTGLIFACIAILSSGIYWFDKKLLRKYEIM